MSDNVSYEEIKALSEAHLKPYREQRNEIMPRFCPFCNGKGAGNEYSFALNCDTGLFKCLRGSCQEQGNFYQLKQHFGLIERKSSKSHDDFYTSKPLTKASEIKPKEKSYLEQRGFSKETLDYCGVTGSEKGGFIFKYRYNQKIRTIDKKMWFEPAGKALTLWLIDKVKTNDILYITEGEWDAMSLIESGVKNVVSLPNGCQGLRFSDKDWKKLNAINKVVLWTDTDAGGLAVRDEIAKRLGFHKVYFVDSEYKDANDCLKSEGPKGVIEAIKQISRPEVPEVTTIEKCKIVEWDSMPKVALNYRALDRLLGGGLPFGYYSILAGVNNTGKTPFVCNLIVSATEQGLNTYFFNGEMQGGFIKNEIMRIIAGTENICENGKLFSAIPKKFESKYSDRIYINRDDVVYSDTGMIEKITEVIQRYDCKFIVIDNLMKIRMSGCTSQWQILERQEIFIENVSKLAKIYNVHILIVQHPTKEGGRTKMSDIRGTGRLCDAASNVLLIHRMNEQTLSDFGYNEMNTPEEFRKDSVIEIAKNRFGGMRGSVGFYHCPITYRFTEQKNENKHERLF